ncbi:hypothetical protein D9613_003328 [Agrocybe pediades]|uniref:F-box domain-containing protein n=1 Tax=Agrocybe pediades TaxID=84607 RepID=A0A8H4VMF0_9AGAR|nr:hypothetical protein D9613_003328 [Agrocybe pediades]
MARRSTRLRGKHVEPPSETGTGVVAVYGRDGGGQQSTEEPQDASIEETEDRKEGGSKPKNKRKRYDEKEEFARQLAVKRQRTMVKRGGLRKLVELPRELGLEIFSYLQPGDLVNLCMISKPLYDVINCSPTLWKTSRKKLADLPPRPEDITEFLYAKLLFVNICHSCNKKSIRIEIIWSARTRLCQKCMDKEFAIIRRPVYDKRLLDLMPAIRVTKGVGKKNIMTTTTHVHLATHQAWVKEYEQHKDTDLAEWTASKLAKWQARQESDMVYEVWFSEEDLRLEKEKKSLVESRQAVIADYVVTLGWGDELSMIRPSEDPRPQDIREVVKACSKDITGKVLQRLEPQLIEHMKQLKEARLKREHQDLLCERIPIMKTFLDNYTKTLRAHDLYPCYVDFYALSEISDIVDNTPRTVPFTLENFDGISLPDLMTKWRLKMESELIKMIREACGEEYAQLENVLQLATTSFTCSRCSYDRIVYPRVLMHACVTTSWLPTDASEIQKRLKRLWNTGGSDESGIIRFNKVGMKTVSKLIEMCGLDPKTTTIIEIQNLNPIFECMECNSIHEGRAIMTWDCAEVHFRTETREHKSHSRTPGQNFKLLVDDVDVFRARIAEQIDRVKGNRDYTRSKGYVCLYCNKRQETREFRRHMGYAHPELIPHDHEASVFGTATWHPFGSPGACQTLRFLAVSFQRRALPPSRVVASNRVVRIRLGTVT